MGEPCSKGSKCQDRSDHHLGAQSHPFDGDYEDSCKHFDRMKEYEKPSLLGLFNWADVDGSGKVSREELKDVVPLLSALAKSEFVISDQAWQELDEDGSG